MKITIAERLRPFSHTPGAESLIPKTWWRLRAFPTLLCFLHKEKSLHLGLSLTGPVKEFTLQQDLEDGVLRVFGKAEEGYFRLRIEALPSGFKVFAEKTPPSGLKTTLGLLESKKELLIPISLEIGWKKDRERLSLGLHKEQDWDLARRRMDMKEFLPPLFLLAQSIPETSETPNLFSQEIKKRESFLSAFFQAHFTHILTPRLIDDQHQGFPFPPFENLQEPCTLIQALFHWVRSFFIETKENSLHLLPRLPSSFVSGRLLNAAVENVGTFDLEWSNGSPRKIVFYSAISKELPLQFGKGVKSFRVRTNLFEKGLSQKTTEPLIVKAGLTYFLDRFCF